MAKSKKNSKSGKSKPAKAKKAPVATKKAIKVVAKKAAVKAKPATKTVVKTVAKKTTPVDYSKVMTPLGDRLVVRLVSKERVTPGGLFIPDTVSNIQGHLKGEVLAAGTGARNKKGHKRPLDVTVGDQIYFDQYSATKINFGHEELHIVKEIDVLGVAND